MVTFPVIKACALISAQSSNLGFKCAISGFCKNASLLSGLNKPEVLDYFLLQMKFQNQYFLILIH